MNIHHMSIGVADLDRAMAFYDRVLAPLGLAREVLFTEPTGTRSAGYGQPGQWALEDNVPFWLEERPGASFSCPPGFHLAFGAPDAAAVHAFHAAGLAAGGTDNGPPGPRPDYGPSYYAAFLIDPDGWRIEAVADTSA
ncbi:MULTISPECIES: VOC family protein [Azorhizobium]|uniref:VOC family protein n=1 Tax=Azorhizobium TaxID=6 RepID=UPI0003018470|nr:catechol 2,3-dioxygenase-like lactoylglutathione lyase family enzyme [Azorhizobium sp. AG788]